jgi:hypothetical protein
MRIIRPRCLSPQPVRKESITKDSEVQVKNGALKPLKQRKSTRHLQRRAERQTQEARIKRRTRKAQRHVDRIAMQTRVAKAMEPEKARQEQNRIKKMLGRFSRFSAYEDVVEQQDDKLVRVWDNERGEIDPPETIMLDQEYEPVLNSERVLDAIFKTEASNDDEDKRRFEALVSNQLTPDSSR